MWINGKWVSVPGLHFAPDDKGSGAPPETPPETPPPDDSTEGDPPDAGKVEFDADQQAAIDTLIGKRLDRAKAKWDKDLQAATDKADSEAKQAKLKDQKKWQDLSVEHEVKIAELEPQVEALMGQVEAYSAVIAEMLTAEIADLGDEAKAAVKGLPGEPDALAQLQWLKANRELFKSDNGKPPGSPPGQQKKTKKPAEVAPINVRY